MKSSPLPLYEPQSINAIGYMRRELNYWLTLERFRKTDFISAKVGYCLGRLFALKEKEKG